VEPPSSITVEEYFSFLADKRWRSDVLRWPPDVFCLLAALLQRTGGYIRLVSNWPPDANQDSSRNAKNLAKWTRQIGRIGRRWWHYSSLVASSARRTSVPSRIKGWWDVIYENRSKTLDELRELVETKADKTFWDAVLQLCSAADEACIGIGLTDTSIHQQYAKRESFSIPKTDFLFAVRRQLTRQSSLKESYTLTRYVRSGFVAVLPKFHTPQSGITLRSISHNLAFLRTSEVKPHFFITETGDSSRHVLNLLLVPWPLRIFPSEFTDVDSRIQLMGRNFGFFGYTPLLGGEAPTTRLRQLLRQAKSETGKIDGVVFPELALSEKQVSPIFSVIKKACGECFMIAGVGDAGTRRKFGANKAIFRSHFGSFNDELEQHKHHRWQLERNQIERYGLGAQLDPTKLWWEHIEIRSRKLSFLSVTDRIALSILICEDLARQDPVADIIRAVGPNLVVALLMDGPQLQGRWPAHYATVFAEDPGSSVLTFTSLGMAELSRPADKPVSRVVGLWRDRFGGFRQIDLEKDAEALVLSLTIEESREWSADGRHDRNDSSYLRLNGIRQIRLPPSNRR
jgi:hypothetical protein